MAMAIIGFAAILPFSSEPNPAYAEAQELLDRMEALTVSLRDGTLSPAEVTGEIQAGNELLPDGSSGTILTASLNGRCFVVHWVTPASRGARAGVLDPNRDCAPSADLLATLPTPPLVEIFPGTVPPLEASQLVTRVGAPRHGTFDPFTPERTPSWFIAAALTLFTVILWQAVGITLGALRRSRTIGTVRAARVSSP